MIVHVLELASRLQFRQSAVAQVEIDDDVEESATGQGQKTLGGHGQTTGADFDGCSFSGCRFVNEFVGDLNLNLIPELRIGWLSNVAFTMQLLRLPIVDQDIVALCEATATAGSGSGTALRQDLYFFPRYVTS